MNFFCLRNVEVSQKLVLSECHVTCLQSPEILHEKWKEIFRMLNCCIFSRQGVFGLEFCHSFSDIYFMSVNSVENN